MPWSVIGDIAAYQMAGKHVVCFNAGFDVHLDGSPIRPVYNIPIPEFEVSCAQWRYYAQFVGEWSKAKKDVQVAEDCLSLLMALLTTHWLIASPHYSC